MTDSPRVAFDVTPLISGRTGIARYVTQLGAALERRGTELRTFAVGRAAFPPPPDARHVRVPARIVERWWRMVPWPPVEQLVADCQLVHATGSLMPRTRRPLVVTVHDIAALRHPELHPQRHVRQQRALLASLERVTVVLSVSSATADDLEQLGIPREKLVVGPLGVTPQALPAPAKERPAAGYLLTVGETSARKRYDLLLRALACLDQDLRLVMAGPPAGDEQRLRSLIQTLGLTSNVTLLGAVSDSMLAGLYQDALALCFPSISEGFGLPLLEAMGAGATVIASDIPVCHEVAGDAAIYPNGDDERAWAEAIEGVVSDPGLRAGLVVSGHERVKAFTWDRTAAATLDAYRLALELAS
jgi:glycosyltransferase involved in cell wall biosynthesis